MKFFVFIMARYNQISWLKIGDDNLQIDRCNNNIGSYMHALKISINSTLD